MIKLLKGILTVIKYIITILVIVFVAIIIVQKVSNNNMSIAGYRIFTVVTESMVPKYNVGDVLLVKHTEPSKIKIEDDVTYIGEAGSFKDKVVTHQVIEIEKSEDGMLKFTTKGIANDEKDPIVNETQIYGVVQKKLAIVTKLNGIMNNTYGMYFLIIIPLAFVVFYEIKCFKEEMNEKKDKESDDEGNNAEEDKADKEDIKRNKRKARRAKRRRRYE